MILTTSDAVFNRRISSYCGVVSGEGRPDCTVVEAVEYIYSMAEMAKNANAAGFRLYSNLAPVVCELIPDADELQGHPGPISSRVMGQVERIVLDRAGVITDDTVEGGVELYVNGETVRMETHWNLCAGVLSFQFAEEVNRPGVGLSASATSQCSRVAMLTIESEAQVLGADAVVGVRVTADPETGVVVAFGTAVKLEEPAESED